MEENNIPNLEEDQNCLIQAEELQRRHRVPIDENTLQYLNSIKDKVENLDTLESEIACLKIEQNIHKDTLLCKE